MACPTPLKPSDTTHVYGGRAALTSAVLGVLAGAVAGYAGGFADRAVSALTDAALAVPRVPFLLLLVALFEPGVALVVLALGLTGWMGVARLTRTEVRAVRARSFVEAARSDASDDRGKDRPAGYPAAQCLCEGHDIGLYPVVLVGEEPPRPAEPHLYFIEYKEHVFTLAELPHVP